LLFLLGAACDWFMEFHLNGLLPIIFVIISAKDDNHNNAIELREYLQGKL
jgi:hypothetical protein